MEKTLAYFFVLWHMKNNRESFISVQTVFWQKLCKLEDLCFKTKEIDKRMLKKVFYSEKKILPSFSITMEQSWPGGTTYSGPQGFLTVIV